MDDWFDRVRDIAWPDFRVYNIEDLKRYLLISLGLFVPLLIWYSVLAAFLADATISWMALAYAPHIVGVLCAILFVSVLGTRLGGCILEIYALVCFKLSFWQLFVGGSIISPLLAGMMFWYSTNLARACFALANERYNARW
jgi:flagellar biosynthesis protein FliQ